MIPKFSISVFLLVVVLASGVTSVDAEATDQKSDRVTIAPAPATTPKIEKPDEAATAEPVTPARICALISDHARLNKIPESFLARLIWKESRFDPDAISPAGAEGIAQFMPATAKRRGLANSFDIEQAIPASAAYLAELQEMFGNLGLAAAAYNAGENRVWRWLTAGGFLPLETENYVLDITGEAADFFTESTRQAALRPLSADMPFQEACEKLPVLATTTTPMAAISRKPWAIIVAGGVKRAAAIRSWELMKAQTRFTIAEDAVYVSNQRLAGGRAGGFSVRIGADSRDEANRTCGRLKASGGACIVLKNR